MKTESRMMGEEYVFKEKAQNENLPHAKGREAQWGWGAGRMVSN